MERLLGLVMSGMIAGTIQYDTGSIQEQYIVESYFKRTDEQGPLVYKLGRILGQRMPGIPGGNLINRTDCSGMLVGHMISMGLVKNRFRDADGNIMYSNGDGLDSDGLYRLGKPIKKRSEVKRGDRVYIERESGQKHIAVMCNNEEIFDLYLGNKAKCRKITAPVMKFATNGAVEYAKKEGIILPETQQVLSYLQEIQNETKQEPLESSNNDNNTSVVAIIIDFVKTSILQM